jgi:small subunit ribosomal protein S5
MPETKRQEQQLSEKVIFVNRVAKVVKGGRQFSFSALVIVGDEKGNVGWGYGKAKEVAEAIRKASAEAKKKMFSVPMDKSTIPHQIIGKFGAARVLLKPAKEGTGIIAAGAVRAMIEAAGIKDILTKCLNSTNPINVVKACEVGLKNLKPKDYRQRLKERSKKEKREEGTDEAK